MKKILKPSQLREHLRSTGLLGGGLFVGVLALAATDVSAQETTQTPAAEVTSGPAAESASDPAAEGALDSSGAETGDQESPSSASTDTQVTDSAAEPVLEETPSAPQSLLDELVQFLDTPEGSSEAGPDLSPMGMFRAADIVVKLVMLGLIFSSVVTWAIWLSKTIEIAGAVGRARRVLRAVNDSRSMAEAAERVGKTGGPAAAMLRAVQTESAFSEPLAGHVSGAGLKERVSSVLDQISATAGRRAAVGTGLLATIGSTAPFVGLFGTVWGIMNSFIGIAEAQSSSLAVVAPGIAEALLATALGLVAAIPAVIIYNACARWITGYRHTLSEVAAGIERLVSRDLDFRHIAAKPSLDAQAAE